MIFLIDTFILWFVLNIVYFNYGISLKTAKHFVKSEFLLLTKIYFFQYKFLDILIDEISKKIIYLNVYIHTFLTLEYERKKRRLFFF